MRWKGQKGSSNVEDRRGAGGGGGAVKLGGFGLIVVIGIVLLMGGDPSPVIDQAIQQGAPAGEYKPTAEEQELAEFTSVVLRYTEDVWNKLYPAEFRKPYEEPGLVLFSGSVSSACGFANSATGPFYCPGDHKVYLDFGFFRQMEKMGASGDFAHAYVIGHEVGHHVQKLLGTSTRVSRLQQQVSRTEHLTEKFDLTAFELDAAHFGGQAGTAHDGPAYLEVVFVKPLVLEVLLQKGDAALHMPRGVFCAGPLAIVQFLDVPRIVKQR